MQDKILPDSTESTLTPPENPTTIPQKIPPAAPGPTPAAPGPIVIPAASPELINRWPEASALWKQAHLPEPTQSTSGFEVYLDSMPMSDCRTRFHAVIKRETKRIDLDFKLSLEILTADHPEHLPQLRNLVENWDPPQSDRYRIIMWLLAESLQQQGVTETKELYQRVVELMRYGSPAEQIPPTREGSAVSPGLLLIDQETRVRLWREYRIDVEALQRESERLYRDAGRFWEVIPKETLPPEKYFSSAAVEFDELVIAHFQKVLHVSELLGGDLGKAIGSQAQLGIEYLKSRERASKVQPPGPSDFTSVY